MFKSKKFDFHACKQDIAKLKDAAVKRERKRREEDEQAERELNAQFAKIDAGFSVAIADVRALALSFLSAERDRLAAAPPEPAKPDVDRVRAGDLDIDEYVAAASAYSGLVEARAKYIRDTQIIAQLQAANATAEGIRAEARALGCETECVAAGIEPIWLEWSGRRGQLESICRQSAAGTLTVAEVQKAIDLISSPRPEPQAPNPTYGHGVRPVAPPTAQQRARRVRLLIGVGS